MRQRSLHLFFFALFALHMLAGCTPHRSSIRFASRLSQATRTEPVPIPNKEPPSAAESPASVPLKSQLEAARFAATLVGQQQATFNGKSFRRDCSGTVRAIYESIGISFGNSTANEPENDSTTIYKFVEQNGIIDRREARVGDLVFFDNTYDRNRDRRVNDGLTHVGVVEQILPDETVLFVHYMGNSIIRSRMNLKYPDKQYDPQTKTRLNHMLRRNSHKKKGLTAAELFAGFGRLNAAASKS